MTINEMFDELENKVRDTYIVTLKYKYDFEEKYTIENQILVYDSVDDSYVWQNDWNEGQTDVEVLGYMLLGDVDTTKVDPCKDSISRDAVMKCFKKWQPYMATRLLGYEQELKELPSVTPQPKWIPVTERLPNAYEFVNCTCHSLIDDREDWVIETVYIPQPSYSPYSDWGNIPMLNSGDCKVVAWMHRDIPEPYKAESEKV